jgi:hypothetical protein
MSEEGADFVGRLGGKNVLELAGLLLDFRFTVESQTVGKKALCETVPADNVSRSLSAPRSQLDNHAAISDRNSSGLERIMTRIHKRLMVMSLRWVGDGAHQSEISHFFYR